MGEQATGQEQPHAEATDALGVDSPTEEDASLADAEGSGAFVDAAPPRGGFEHRRVVNMARQRLFGRGQPLYIGRYRVGRRLGTGGMGEVYLAHDEALDRKVAVKRVLATSTNARDQERLRREARALARLTHPNVVGVYEVDEHEGRTFVAMEYVDGHTLGAWLEEGGEPRAWRAVLDIFVAAGRGLAAAHEAGLVHRDFKPDNVLLSRSGEVRVADFGLVLAGARPAWGEDEGEAASTLPAETPMSVTGAVRGTIRYMPLEQLRGEPVDARSDQFSFCVALYEALYAEPPFSVASTITRLAELQRGEPKAPRPREGRRPPAALWRLIRRGLSKDPAARWPDMNALLAALDQVTRRRRRLGWTATALAAVAVAVGGVALFAEPEVDPCGAVARELEGTWDDARRRDLEALVGADGLDGGAAHVGDSMQRVLAGLDRWSTGWTSEREQVCRANAERRIEPELARLQSNCLTRQRQRVEDLVGLLLQPETDADALASAVEAVAELPPASACEEELAMLGVEPPPVAIAEEVEAVRRDIARAHELRLLGRVEEGLTLAEHSELAARELGYGALQAEALAELARGEFVAGSLEQAVKLQHDAVDSAELNRHDYLAAELWIEFTLSSLIESGSATDGIWQLRRAEIANGRLKSSSARSQGRLAFARGQLAELQRKYAEAELGYRKALEIIENSAVGQLDAPTYLSNLARIVGRHDDNEAISILESAVVTAERQYGPSHPQTALMLYDLALARRTVDPKDGKIASLLERALDIWMQSHKRPNQNLARAELVLGSLALQRHDIDQAEGHARRLASIQASVFPEHHVSRGETAHLLGMIYSVRGEHEQALTQYQAALEVWKPSFGLENPGVQRVYGDIAATLLALGRIDEAAMTLEFISPHALNGSEQIGVRLSRSEVALRQGDLITADAELEAIDGEALGDHEFSYLVLRALVDLRRGKENADTQGRLREQRSAVRFTHGQIEDWLNQLDLTAAERNALNFD